MKEFAFRPESWLAKRNVCYGASSKNELRHSEEHSMGTKLKVGNLERVELGKPKLYYSMNTMAPTISPLWGGRRCDLDEQDWDLNGQETVSAALWDRASPFAEPRG